MSSLLPDISPYFMILIIWSITGIFTSYKLFAKLSGTSPSNAKVIAVIFQGGPLVWLLFGVFSKNFLKLF